MTVLNKKIQIMFSITKVIVVMFYFCNATHSFTNYSTDNYGFDSDYWNSFYEDFNFTYDYTNFEQFLIMSKPYFEKAVQMCPTVTFCTFKQNVSSINQELHVSKNETVYTNILSGSSSSMMSNTSFLDMITTPSYSTATWSSLEVYSHSSSYYTTMPTTGSASGFSLFLPPMFQSSNYESIHGSCCGQCSCSQDCSLANKCCVDAPLYIYHSPLLTFCRSAYIKFSRQRSKVNWPELDYLIVEHSGSNCLKDLSDHRNSIFDDLALVSTKEMVYKNKRHATCNGETDVKSWDLIVTDCEDDLYSLQLDGSALIEYVLENCLVYSAPPDGVEPQPFVCHQIENIIDSCNQTQLWDFKDALLSDLCYSSDFSYAYDEDGMIFANIFCLMCNKPFGYTMPKTCGIKRKFTTPTKGPAYKLLSRDWLNETIWNDREVDMRPAAKCSDNMVFDDHLTKCRELFCPFQGFPTSGHCSTQRPFVAINRIFVIGFSVHLPENMTIVDSRQTKIIKFHDFFEALGFRGLCEIITAEFSAVIGEGEVNTSNIFVSIRLKSSQSCDEDLTNKLFPTDDVTQHSRSMSLQVNRTILNVTVEPLHKQQVINYSSRNLTLLYRQGNDIKCSGCYIEDPGELLCPYFILNRSEYCSLYKTLSAAPKAVCSKVPFDDRISFDDKYDNDVGNDVYYVCARDYKLLKVIESQERYVSSATTLLPTIWITMLFFCSLLS